MLVRTRKGVGSIAYRAGSRTSSDAFQWVEDEVSLCEVSVVGTKPLSLEEEDFSGVNAWIPFLLNGYLRVWGERDCKAVFIHVHYIFSDWLGDSKSLPAH
mgnify:CR=1 FL=1